MSENFTLYDDSKYENHATNELPLTSKNISKKEELSKAFIKPIILDRNNHLEDDNWEFGLKYTGFTGSDVQNAFGAGLDAAKDEKLSKLKKLADAMYHEAQYLTTDASRLHKAMEEYRQYVINELKEG